MLSAAQRLPFYVRRKEVPLPEKLMATEGLLLCEKISLVEPHIKILCYEAQIAKSKRLESWTYHLFSGHPWIKELTWLTGIQIIYQHFRIWYFYFPSKETDFMESYNPCAEKTPEAHSCPPSPHWAQVRRPVKVLHVGFLLRHWFPSSKKRSPDPRSTWAVLCVALCIGWSSPAQWQQISRCKAQKHD